MSMNQYNHLPPSLQRIIDGIRHHQHSMKPSLAKKIVLEAGVRMGDLNPWESYNHPLADSYGRKLVFAADFFEIMVMSWTPGDVSAIHDHGYTEWGAVQIFGPAEHATFLVQDDSINTLSREVIQPGKVIAVGHQLVHQMANRSQEKFLSLHVYGVNTEDFAQESVTADARIWNITDGVVQRTNGGVFFALPDEKINSIESAPFPDSLSWLNHTVEYLRRVRKAAEENHARDWETLETRLTQSLFDVNRWYSLKSEIMEHIDSSGHTTNTNFWNIIRKELIHAAHLQGEILNREKNQEDSFFTYAELYDEIIGKQCLEGFTSRYIKFVHDTYNLDFPNLQILSIGCGTGIMEEYILKNYSVPSDNLLGIDVSEAMVKIASKKINASVGNILEMTGGGMNFDLSFASLNVFQYLPQEMMEKAIQQTSEVTKKGGYFVGDFITSDHIRWYPNVITSENVISLRQPLLLEENHNTLQQSEIINISKMHGKLQITYEGKHVRYLPSLWKVRYFFNKYFASVDIFDAVTLEPLESENDTCPSTRYLVVAKN
ncbi:MAG: methyltransferase domain-containing protein [Nostocaceae cyanobacterium]|nr:methyltransferase domain-containing protein [Nostocaceae cyanobacterium]